MGNPSISRCAEQLRNNNSRHYYLLAYPELKSVLKFDRMLNLYRKMTICTPGVARLRNFSPLKERTEFTDNVQYVRFRMVFIVSFA